MISLFSYELTYFTLLALVLIAISVGMAKTGVHGVSMLAIPVLALLFGGKDSSGLMLPMLVFADIFAVKYYHRHANWHYLRRIFPWTAVGVAIGTLIGNAIDDETFKAVMAFIILTSILILIWMEKAESDAIPDYTWFAALMGILAGITSMVGNAAFAVMALYLLSMRLPKNEYIGTAAWFFLVLNLFKVPFHVFSWQTITTNSFLLNVSLAPFVLMGALIGIQVVKRIPDKYYRWFIIGVTALSSLMLFY